MNANETSSTTSTSPLAKKAFDLGDVLWIMHCAEGPIPLTSEDAAHALLEKEAQPWRMRWEEDFLGLPRRVKVQAAKLLGARPEDVSLTATTTTGLATVAQGLPWEAGDEVVVPLGEFPSNAWPWKTLAARGVEFREVPLWPGHTAAAAAWSSTPPPVGVDPEAALAAALGPRTRVLSVSWVRFQDGLVLNLERLGKECRRRGVLLVVDGIQGAGTLPIELDRLPGVAAFASGGHKGLLAPQGLGVLWTTPELRAQLTPPGGWLSVAGATDFSRPSTDLERSWLADGSKLETGVPNLLGCASLEESLRLLNRPDRGVLARHVAGLQWLLLEKLGGSKLWGAEAERLLALLMAGRIGSILSFHHRGQGPEALQKLLEEGIQRRIYASVREGYLRIALHGFHEPEDVERILDWMEER